MKCNQCQYFDRFGESNGGACHAMPPTLMRDNDQISEHRPFVALDDKACSLLRVRMPPIDELIA